MQSLHWQVTDLINEFMFMFNLNYFSGSTSTQMNDFDNGHYFYKLKQGISSRTRCETASVMNLSTLEGVIYF